MAAGNVNVYADKERNLWLDEDRTKALRAPLYQAAGDIGNYFLDKDLTTAVTIHGLELICQGEREQHVQDKTMSPPITSWDHTPIPPNTNFEQPSASSPNTSPDQTFTLPPNTGFSKGQTLFLIDLMRQHLEGDCRGLPRTLAELNSRVKAVKGKKKQLWVDLAAKLTSQFRETFDPEKVGRKWATLEEAYKKIRDNNRSTGQSTMRFQFYTEMENLLGGNHNIDYPVVGTAEGVDIRRPEAVGIHVQEEQPTKDAHPSCCTPVEPTQVTPLRRKRRAEDDSLLQYLKESETRHEAARQTRHEELLKQMKSSQESFMSMMSAFLDKL